MAWNFGEKVLKLEYKRRKKEIIMLRKNVLDELEIFVEKGGRYYRKQEHLCIIFGPGCKFYVTHLGGGRVNIDSTKILDTT